MTGYLRHLLWWQIVQGVALYKRRRAKCEISRCRAT